VKVVGSKTKKHVLVIGAGPAGLTAGVELLKTDRYAVTLLEREDVVGGLARTTDYKGCKFDIGPHHFITEAPHIEAWWKAVMKGDFIKHKRFTRIFYNRHFFHYPLDPVNVIRGLNIFECARSILSYLRYRFFPIKEIKSFQDWVTNRFGARLFSIFFKTYTEKVWGIECHKISSDWAAQRIKGFSLSKAIFYAFFGRWFKKNAPRTLSDEFYYPSRGAGTLWQKVSDQINDFDHSRTYLNQEVVTIEHEDNRITAVMTKNTSTKKKGLAQKPKRIEADYFLSTMPLKTLIHSLDPIAPDKVLRAADSLRYRGLITINLIVKATDVCPDHWIYVHEKTVRMGRIGNMNNFSVKMSDSPDHTALSLEYFAFIDEPFWKKPDDELIAIGTRELESTGLIPKGSVVDGMIMRTSEAYPVYDQNYKEHLSCVLTYLQGFSNLHLMGRNGLHRYNNMDIAMLSALDVVKKITEEQPIIKKRRPMKRSQVQV
jgi:protoporphyrinogen oxidase